mgnify:CR=1 FL=1
MDLYGGKGTKLGATINTWLAFLKAYSEKFPKKLAKAKADKKYKEYVSKVASLYKKAKEKGKIAPLSHNDERKHAPSAPRKRPKVAPARKENIWSSYLKRQQKMPKGMERSDYLSNVRQNYMMMNPNYTLGQVKESKPKSPTVKQLKEYIKDTIGFSGKLTGLKKPQLMNIVESYQESFNYPDEGFDPTESESGYMELPDFAFNFPNATANSVSEIPASRATAFSNMKNKELLDIMGLNSLKPFMGRKKQELIDRLVYYENTGKGF